MSILRLAHGKSVGDSQIILSSYLAELNSAAPNRPNRNQQLHIAIFRPALRQLDRAHRLPFRGRDAEGAQVVTLYVAFASL